MADWIDFLGIERSADPTRWSLPIDLHLAGGAGQLFGGCGLGAAVGVLEELTAKPAAWATAQFLSNAFPGERLDLVATVAVAGRNFSQARVVASVGDREVFTVLAALGAKRFDGRGRWCTMPRVEPPERCALRTALDPEPGRLHEHIEQRVAIGEWGDERLSPSGTSRVWMRMDGTLAGASLGLAVAADFLPLALRAALGRDLFGTSLDNTIRYIGRGTTEWVLADLHVDELSDGVGHGTVQLWSADGELLAVASQTCALRELNPPPG